MILSYTHGLDCLEAGSRRSVSPNRSLSVSNLFRLSSVADSIPVERCVDPPPLSDGFHVSDEAMARNVQVLLNLYCNNHMNFEDGTCCRSAEPITPVQTRCFIFIGLCYITCLSYLYAMFLSSTILFMKTNKGFTIMSFLLPLAYFLVLGLFFSGPTKEVRKFIIAVSIANFCSFIILSLHEHYNLVI
ncbi:CAS1 domain-containing protein 1 [Fasciola gigantica]|uniref:CAS1 domain-containing protein 1 n=1 Tax=Fasciola gigantica TaxID=46835 RepID=A0A504Z0Q0_FASGI|nr:CAS1 domain-containing protein 1 [Fasciola gigantica]